VVFFKSKDDKALEAAFNEYSKITLKHKEAMPSMLGKLRAFKELAKNALTPAKNRNRGGHEI
jgi:16S rRNA C1402 N4-methylase RsmH